MKPSKRTTDLRELLHREKQGQILDGADLVGRMMEIYECENAEELVNRLMVMSEDLDKLNWAPYHLNEARVHIEKVLTLIPEECR